MQPKWAKCCFLFQEIQKTGSRLLLSACDVLRSSPKFGEGSRTAVLNTLSWERTEVIELPEEGTQRKLGTRTCDVHKYWDICSKTYFSVMFKHFI